MIEVKRDDYEKLYRELKGWLVKQHPRTWGRFLHIKDRKIRKREYMRDYMVKYQATVRAERRMGVK